MRRIREVAAPSGLSRLLYRMPIPLFRLGLGGLAFGRLLLLEHHGRRSGLTRYAVIEVLRHDPERGAWIVSSGWGERTHWYRNLLHQPRAWVRVGWRRRSVVARVLEDSDAEAEVLAYGHARPQAAQAVARLIGWELDGSDADLCAFARELKLLELREDTSAPG